MRQVLELLGVAGVVLHTNNPDKIAATRAFAGDVAVQRTGSHIHGKNYQYPSEKLPNPSTCSLLHPYR